MPAEAVYHSNNREPSGTWWYPLVLVTRSALMRLPIRLIATESNAEASHHLLPSSPPNFLNVTAWTTCLFAAIMDARNTTVLTTANDKSSVFGEAQFPLRVSA